MSATLPSESSSVIRLSRQSYTVTAAPGQPRGIALHNCLSSGRDVGAQNPLRTRPDRCRPEASRRIPEFGDQILTVSAYLTFSSVGSPKLPILRPEATKVSFPAYHM